jgi:hypothetical protein
VTGGCRKLHSKGLHISYVEPSVIGMIKTKMRWTRYDSRTGKMNADRLLVGKLRGKCPLGTQRHSWVNNIKIDLSQREWGGMDWIDLAEDKDQWKVLL